MVEEGNQIKSPALLSKSELQWLLGKSSSPRTFQYKMLSNIRRKIRALIDIDLPLLRKNNLVSFELGRHLEPMTTPSVLAKSTQALVRQRSRVQIPVKAPCFVKRSNNMVIFDSINCIRFFIYRRLRKKGTI